MAECSPTQAQAHTQPDPATIRRLSEKALTERVEVRSVHRIMSEDPFDYTFKASSGSDDTTEYHVYIHAPDPMGLDQPIQFHCTCPAGSFGRACKHAALALRTLNMDIGFEAYQVLDTEAMEHLTTREEATIEQP